MLAGRSPLLLFVVVAVVLAGAIADEQNDALAVKIATHSHLNDATALANKNAVMSAQNVATTRSNIRAQQDDDITGATDDEMEAMATATGDDSTQPSDVPAGLVLTGDRDTLQGGTESDVTMNKGDDELAIDGKHPPSDLTLTGERDVLISPDATNDKVEQFIGYRRRFFYPGFRGGYYGWRYPLPYWRSYGARFYGGRCAFGRIYGGFFYC